MRIVLILIVLAAASVATTAVALTGDGGGASAQAGPVSAFPAPGTRTAQRGTEISLRGAEAGAIGTVTVTGSKSGRHEGTLEPHPDGRGASFVPSANFRPGERVTVETGLDVRGASAGSYAFTVARGDFERPTRSSDRSVPRARKGTYHAYRSTSLKAPRLTVTPRRGGRAPGYLVMNTGWDEDRPRPEGILIADDRGRPVFFRQREAQTKMFDFEVQEYQGRPVLTYWEGVFAAGWGYGEWVMLDESYREIRRIRAMSGYRADIHDMRITPEGTAVIMSYNAVRYDLRRVGGPRNGLVLDNVIQEIDLDSRRILFEWHSLGNIALAESRDRPERGQPFDYFHINSIDVGPDGDLLISARNTCAVYEIDRTTGAINWRLGGKRSDFRMSRSARFCRQHDARWYRRGEISIFDNHVDRIRDGGESRAIKLRVDERRKRARLLRGYKHPGELAAQNKGGTRVLPNGNVIVAFGAIPVVTESTRTGRIVLNARFARAGDGSYRAMRTPWVGRPATDPDVAAQRRGGRTAGWGRWPGATVGARWEGRGGDAPDALARVGSRGRTGFETAISVDARPAYVAVRALDADGTVLGTSRAVRAD